METLLNRPVGLQPTPSFGRVRFAGESTPPSAATQVPVSDTLERRLSSSLLSLSSADRQVQEKMQALFQTLPPEELLKLDHAKQPPIPFMHRVLGSGLGLVSVPLPSLDSVVQEALQRPQSGGRSFFRKANTDNLPTLRQIQESVPESVARELEGLLGEQPPENRLRNEFVGQGYGKAQALAAIDMAREVGMDVATFLGVNSGLGAEIISKVGTQAQQTVWLNALNRGMLTYAFGLTEPTAGSDPRSMQTTFRKEVRNGKPVYVLNGEKKFIGNGAQVKDADGNVTHRGADFIVIFAVDDPSKPPEQRSYRAFMVPRTAIGEDNIQRTGADGKVGLNVVNNGDITLKDVVVPESFVLGSPNQDMYRKLLGTLDETRLFVGAMGVGMAESFVKDARAYAGQRHQYGKAIQGHQAVNKRINEAAANTLVARLMVMEAARKIDAAHRQQAAGEKPDVFKNDTSMAKLFATEVARDAATMHMTTRGGNGFLEDDMAKRFRDVQVAAIYEGTSDIQRNLIAQGEIIQAGKQFERQYGGSFSTKASYVFHKLTGQQAQFEAQTLSAMLDWLRRQQPKHSLEQAKTPVQVVEAAHEAAMLDTIPRYFESLQARKQEVAKNGLPERWQGWDQESIDRELMQEALSPVQLRMHALADLAMYKRLSQLADAELKVNEDLQQQALLKLFLQQAQRIAKDKLEYLASDELKTEEALHQLQNG